MKLNEYINITEKNIIVDGNYIAYRLFYSSYNNNLHMIDRFIDLISYLNTLPNVKSTTVVFDHHGKNIRTEIYPEYKNNRKQMPGDLISNINILKDRLMSLNIPILCIPEYEADDVIYTLVELSDDIVFIVTKDKDLYQLVNDSVFIFDPFTNTIITEQDVIRKYGIPPSSIPDYLALSGDYSDNIPGVKGIGAKIARNLISSYGSIDEVYRNIQSIDMRISKLLISGYDSAKLSKRLITLQYVYSVENIKKKEGVYINENI